VSTEKDPRLARLTPEAVMNMGYMYHVALSPTYEDTPSRETAVQIIRSFNAIEPNGDVEGYSFLLGIQAIAVSYGNSVFRASSKYAREIDAARREYERQESELKSSRLSGINLSLAMKLLAIAALGLTGFQIAQLIGYFVPGLVREKTGNTLPSLVLGAIFVLVGNYVSTWWKNHQLRKIEVHYNLRILMADRLLEAARLSEFRSHWERARHEWEAYMGEKLPSDLPSYLFILEREAESREEWRAQERELNQSDLAALIQSLSRLVVRFREKKPKSV